MTDPSHGIRNRTLAALQSTFGYPAFRGNQADVIAHVAAGNSAFVLMPTGGGKSLCYQIPALVREGVTVVISPLIALMQDQVAALQRRGVPAALLNSTLSRDETARIEADVRRGAITLLYVSPERLLTPRCMTLLATARLALFAIDEAHCIAEWGHDFRPNYLGLSVLAERFPGVPRIALTATADAETQADIIRRLGLTGARRFSASFDRPNIRICVVPKRNAHKQLLRFIRARHAGHAGVVYCQSRARVEETAAFLDAHGIPALPYHAGLTTRQREENQAWFLQRPGVVVVATIAFGMGIDKPDVRFVAHIDVPVSIEGYYQEIGRAGRDGLPAEAWLAYSVHDATALHRRIDQSAATDQRKRVRTAKLEAMLALCETAACRRSVLLAYFGESVAACGTCDTCTSPPPTIDATLVLRRLLAALSSGAPHRTAHELADALARDDIGAPAWRRRRTAGEWRLVIRQCIALGVLALDHERGGVIVVRPRGQAAAHGARPFRLPVLRPGKAPKAERRPRPAADPHRDALCRQLHAWREASARRRGVPDHVICHDSALAALAARRPRSRFALRWIPGMGPKRTAMHGRELLGLIASACNDVERRGEDR